MTAKTAANKPIGTIEEELAECLAEIAKYPQAKWFWALHHEQLCEERTEPIKNRIAYIRKEKPECEQAVRFRNLRPVKNETALLAAWAEYEKVKARAWAEYEKVTARAWAEYEKVKAPALAEYDKVKARALAEYDKVTARAWAEYEKVTAPALAAVADQFKSEWPDNTWQGKSIFAEAIHG